MEMVSDEIETCLGWSGEDLVWNLKDACTANLCSNFSLSIKRHMNMILGKMCLRGLNTAVKKRHVKIKKKVITKLLEPHLEWINKRVTIAALLF